MKEITVNKNDANQRIDKFLQKYLKKAPLSMIYKAIRKKRVKVNKKKCDISYKLQENDVLELYINDEFFDDVKEEFTKSSSDLDIIYEDSNIILINKKKGISVHSNIKEEKDTVINMLLSYLYKKKEYDPKEEHSFRPALCNRIDRNTEGIVIGAKNAEALKEVNEKIKNNEIKKYYLCIALGIFNKKEDTLVNYLKKDNEKNMVKIYDKEVKDSKKIITEYKVLKEKNNLSLVEVKLITGRTHQIRAHLSYIGHPLLGERKYNNNMKMPFNIKYQALCSYKLSFDFKEKGGILYYLSGKEFKLKNVELVNKFNNL